MDKGRALFPIDRLSTVLAFITLAMGLTYLVPPTSNEPVGNILGFIINIRFDLYTLVILLLPLLAMFGTLWLLQSHPSMEEFHQKTWQLLPNVILPVLSVFVLSISLREMSRNNVWWVVYLLGAFLLGLVLAAEYNVVDIGSTEHPLASIGLIGLSHALFLILVVVLKTVSQRLYIILPLVLIASGFVALRTIYLRLKGQWQIEYAIGICLILAQVTIGLHYLFLNPIQFGLILTGALYSLISIACGLINHFKTAEIIIEPALMIVFTAVLVILVA